MFCQTNFCLASSIYEGYWAGGAKGAQYGASFTTTLVSPLASSHTKKKRQKCDHCQERLREEAVGTAGARNKSITPYSSIARHKHAFTPLQFGGAPLQR